MPREVHLPPSASSLCASMRDIGYTLETAIADLVDNSISAGASEVKIYCTEQGAQSCLAIVDNGHGMTEPEIITAMRHGGEQGRPVRSAHDLGKFGLGLKTASFSQCRRLTVVSRTGGRAHAAEWNLDVVDKRDDWVIMLLDEAEISALPYANDLGPQGTLVLWRSLDRLFENSEGRQRQSVMNEKIVAVERHLGLVFHRFLSGEVDWHGKLSILVNNHRVQDFDPFVRSHSATQHLPHEILRFDRHEVNIRGYILPHHSKLPAQLHELYRTRSEFVANQGVYIYRNCRLIAWGGWFRLAAKEEITKLARVQIDFPSALDRYWTVDIKKSRARPPRAVRNHLKNILGRITGQSVRVQKGRGQRLRAQTRVPVWNRVTHRSGIHYRLNDSHPLAEAVRRRLDTAGQAHLRLLLSAIAASLPMELIYSDWAGKPKSVEAGTDGVKATTVERLELLRQCVSESKRFNGDAFRQLARSTGLFDRCWGQVEEFVKGWAQ